MAVVIRLQRTGKPQQAYFRVVAVEKRRGPRGEPLEVLGSYDPRAASPAGKIQLRRERYEHWLKHGAKPSETVAQLVRGAQEGPKAAAR